MNKLSKKGDAVPPVIHYTSSELPVRWPDIKAIFSEYGFVVVVPTTDDKQAVLDICQRFGAIQRHARSPEDGVVDVLSGESPSADDKSIVADIPYFSHTDGIYLDGFCKRKGIHYRVVPPKVVALQCVRQAKKGGETFLVDGARILPSVVDSRPYLISTLFSPDKMIIMRQSHVVPRVPVFDIHHSRNFSMYFSSDADTYGVGCAVHELNTFNYNYASNKDFATFIRLSERQILLFDNHRFLHGRTKVEGERHLRRVWVCDDQTSQKMLPLQVEGPMYERSHGADHQLDISEAYSKYGPISNDNIDIDRIPIGIPLSLKYRKKIATILEKRFLP